MAKSRFGLEQKKFNKGSKIYTKGDKADFAYYVHAGKVNIYSPGGLLLGQIGEGEIFGEMAIIDGEARSANALAQESCELLAIQKNDFISLLRNNFKISLGLMSELAKRLRKSDQQIEALTLSDAEHRIGVSILNLAEDRGVIRKGNVTIEKLPFQQDIANMAGTSRETVSRVLKLFEDKALVTKVGHRLTIPDYPFFKKLFGKSSS